MVTNAGKSSSLRDPIAGVSEFLADELCQVEATLQELIESDSPLIREVGEYICLTSGKKLRPIITLLSERAFGPIERPSIRIAAAMEAIHVATLLHDDVIDKAPLRRGVPTVNAKYGDEVAILMADFLYASCFELAMDNLTIEPLRLICNITRQMCEGEMFQFERRGKWMTPDDYMYVITRKTAFLFSGCSAIGGIRAGLPKEAIDALATFGLNFGLAFQITDDTLDYTASDEQWGKSLGNDLETGKQTLPLILALREASPEDRRKLESILNNGRDFKAIREMIRRGGTIEQTLNLAQSHLEEAIRRIETVKVYDTLAFDHLKALTRHVVHRRY